MQNDLSDRTKIGMILAIAIISLALATLIYYYQNNKFLASADTLYRVPSKLCISGKMKLNGQYVADKCIYDINKQRVTYTDDIAFQIGEKYTITYTMGDFINNEQDTSYQAPHQTCMTGENPDGYGWIYTPLDFDASLSTILGVAIDEPIFDPVLFTDSISLAGHNTLPEVDYHDAPISRQGNISNFKYLKKYDLTVSGAESVKPKGYDFTFDQSISCKDNIGIGNTIYYGGAHQPGDFISLSFMPSITKAQGNILGYSVNDSSLTPNLNGNLIKTKYKIVANLDDYDYKQTEIVANLDSDNDGIIDTEDTDIDGNGILDQDETDLKVNTPSSDLATRISKGSVLWFNLFIAFLIIIIVWYIMFREKIQK